MAEATANAISDRWKSAKQVGKEAELIAEWVTSGFLIIHGAIGATRAVARGSVAIAREVGKILGSRLPATLEAELNHMVQARQIALSTLNSARSNISRRTVIQSNSIDPARIANSAEQFGINHQPSYSVELIHFAKTYGITSNEGLAVFSRIYEPIRSLPEAEILLAPKTSSWMGKRFDLYEGLEPHHLAVKRIRIGKDPNKIAIIGRIMGKSDGSTIGVHSAKVHFKMFGIHVETFEMNPNTWDSFLGDVTKYRNKTGNFSAMLPANRVIETDAYRENKEWVKWLNKNNYTILDFGNPINNYEFSVFYSMEKEFIFRR